MRAVLEMAAGLAAAVGCAWSWLAVRTTVAVAPIIDGQPATTSVVYHPPALLLTLLLATIAGVLTVLGAVRLWRRQHEPYTP